MKTLYNELDLKADATEKQIKAAFRKRVKKVHPDIGGDETEFRKVREAYAVLSDVVLREEYDRTGYYNVPGSEVSPTTIIGGLFVLAIAEHLKNPRVDIVVTIKNAIKRERENIMKKIAALEEAIEKHEGLKKKIVYKGKEDGNFLVGMLDSSIIGLRRELKANQLQMDVSKVALEIMKNYKFDNEDFSLQFKGPNFSTTTGSFSW